MHVRNMNSVYTQIHPSLIYSCRLLMLFIQDVQIFQRFDLFGYCSFFLSKIFVYCGSFMWNLTSVFMVWTDLICSFLKGELKQRIATMYDVRDPNSIIVFNFRNHFGGGKSTGFGLIYDSVENAKKFEPKYRLVRVIYMQ